MSPQEAAEGNPSPYNSNIGMLQHNARSMSWMLRNETRRTEGVTMAQYDPAVLHNFTRLVMTAVFQPALCTETGEDRVPALGESDRWRERFFFVQARLVALPSVIPAQFLDSMVRYIHEKDFALPGIFSEDRLGPLGIAERYQLADMLHEIGRPDYVEPHNE